MNTQVKIFTLTANGMQPVATPTFQIGQIFWLNGYGQGKGYAERKAIYEIDGDMCKWVNLDKPERGRKYMREIQHEDKLFGIGSYYTPGQFATPEEITEAVTLAIAAEENEKTVKAAEALAYAEFMKPWGDIKSLPDSTINRTWFKNAMRAGKLLVKCNGKYTDDYAFDAAYNFRMDDFYTDCAPDYFDDWYISTIRIHGNKEGFISVSFASCEYYTFLLKPEFLSNRKDVEPAPEIAQVSEAAPVADVRIVRYSDKAIAVTGNTYPIKDTLKANGGKFNAHLTIEGCKVTGWIFSATKEAEIKKALGL